MLFSVDGGAMLLIVGRTVSAIAAGRASYRGAACFAYVADRHSLLGFPINSHGFTRRRALPRWFSCSKD